jgi:hypothetical protein
MQVTLDDYYDGFNDQRSGDLICDGTSFACMDATSNLCVEGKIGDFCAAFDIAI